MRRSSPPAMLLAAALISIAGCSHEPSPLSPLASEDPARYSAATTEMEEMARRNREAEAAFYRKHAVARPPAPEANSNPSAFAPETANSSTADSREKS